MIGVLFTSVLFGALAVRSAASEYSTGMIRQTFSATPDRRRVVVAKLTAVVGLAVPVALVGNLAGFVAGQQVLTAHDADVSLASADAFHALVFGTASIVIVAALGIGLGFLLRRTAAATTAIAVAVVGSQLFAMLLPAASRPYLPGSALHATVTSRPDAELLSPAGGLLALTVYAVVAVLAATALVRRRDVA